ncbi:MAG: phage minor head protein [Candidatus Contendobacter sp.]|nr:phage minor head protein [Candidatus Contendobacter sp.]
MAVNYGSLPFAEALEFFRQKLNLPTAKWDELLGAAHDRAFVVAGATLADLLADLNAAVDKAISQGTTYQTFKKDFEKIVAERGWTGWTGEGSKGGRAWRARVIYETNLYTSHAAGRFQQMKEVANSRPYWRYRHSDAVTTPRPEHQAWDGKILRHDDPWWAAHAPPNGFGCKCYVETLAARDLKKLGIEPPTADAGEKMPFNGTVKHINKKTGEVIELPEGVDKGWDYQPGASVAEELAKFAKNKAAAMANNDPAAVLAKAYVADLVQHPQFQRFFAGELQGEYPLAVLDAALRQAMDALQPVVVLSKETVEAHRHHPEVSAADYILAQRILDEGELYEQGPGRMIALLKIDGKLYRAALKRTGDKEKNYWLTLFLTDEDRANREVRNKFKRVR